MALLHPGLVLAQRYRLEELIGSGAMSQVWRARDEVLRRPVAIKMLGGSSDPLLYDLIHREARAAAGITHPHVTQVFDFGEAPLGDDGDALTPYLVMEYLDGESLAAAIAEGALPAVRAVRICAEVAGALAAAHAQGVIHRDIKPANVMLTQAGAKVVDFGIAALADSTLGGAGPVPARAGTPGYVAPEVAAGRAATTGADLYALGALLHETLTGAPPPPVELSGVPAQVADLVRRCLSQEREHRPSGAEAEQHLRQAASSLAIDEAGRARPAGRVIGVAVVPRPAVGTLLDASQRAPAAADPAPAEPAAQAPIALVRRRRPTALALLALTAVLVGAVLLGAALLAGGQKPSSGAAGSPNSQVTRTGPATPPAPSAPTTPAAALEAIRSAIAAALDAGEIDARTAQALANDVRELSERLQRGRSLTKRADDLRERLADQVDDGEIDAKVAARVDDLLETLVRLAQR